MCTCIRFKEWQWQQSVYERNTGDHNNNADDGDDNCYYSDYYNGDDDDDGDQSDVYDDENKISQCKAIHQQNLGSLSPVKPYLLLNVDIYI